MFREEKIINDVLCWRNTPNGEWITFTPKELTLRLRTLEFAYKELEKCYDEQISADRLKYQWT